MISFLIVLLWICANLKRRISSKNLACALYKDSFGEIKLKRIKNMNKFRIDKSYNPVI